MKMLKHLLAAAAVLVACGAQAQPAAQSGNLLRSADDQIPTVLQIRGGSSADLERRPIATSWAIDADSALDARPTPFLRESREYWRDASAAELHAGVNLAISAKGGLLRLSPRQGSAAIDASRLVFRSNGQAIANARVIENLADADALRAAGMDVPDGSVILRLSDEVDTGQIQLLAPDADGDYLIHVFEPNSRVVLDVQAGKDSVIAGEPLRIRAHVHGATLERVGGLVSSPRGHSQPADFVRQADGSYVATVTPDSAHAGGHGLWEAHVFAGARDGRLDVQRDARTAFAVSLATARLDGRIERVPASAKGDGLRVRIGVESAGASRYQLAGVLYATTASGLRPVAVGHAASWLEAGSGTIELHFDSDALAASGANAPFELRDLRLIDQSDMGLIERRERAAVIRQ